MHLVSQENIAVGAVHFAFNNPEDLGDGNRHDQVHDAADKIGFKIPKVVPGNCFGLEEQLGHGNNAQDAGVLDVDNEFVAGCRQDIADDLGQYHIEHGLHMVHPDGVGCFKLPFVDGDDAAPDDFRHIGSGIDGDNEEGGKPAVHIHTHCQGVTVNNNSGLYHHRGPAENFDVDGQKSVDKLEDKSVYPFVGYRDGTDDPHQQANTGPDQGADDGDHQSRFRPPQEHRPICGNDSHHPIKGHDGASFNYETECVRMTSGFK